MTVVYCGGLLLELVAVNITAMGLTASGASGGAVTRRTGWLSIIVTLHLTEKQHACSAAAKSVSSSWTPVTGW